MHKRRWFRFVDFYLIYLKYSMKMKYLVSSRQNYFISIEYLIAGRVGRNPEPPPWFRICNAYKIAITRTKLFRPLQVIQLSEYLLKGHYLENSLI